MIPAPLDRTGPFAIDVSGWNDLRIRVEGAAIRLILEDFEGGEPDGDPP